MSRITAPVGEVTTPITAGRYGSGLLARLVEQALGGKLLAPLFQQRHQRADAGRLDRVDDDLVFRLAGKVVSLPVAIDLEPFLRLERAAAQGTSFQITASIRALSSLTQK